MNNVCGLCAYFWKIESDGTRYFFTHQQDEIQSAIFKECNGHGLVHESFAGCMSFVPTKSFYCARFESIVNTEICLNKQIREDDESCYNCQQGAVVIDIMRGVRCSELK